MENKNDLPPYVVDIDSAMDLVNCIAEKQDDPEQAKKGAEAELKRYRQMVLVAFAKSERFSGLFRGSLPQIQVQLEGTRSMACARLPEASWT